MSEDKVYFKNPMWNGKKSEFPVWKAKLISLLSQKNMTEILEAFANGTTILKDSESHSAADQKNDAAKKLEMTLKKQNKIATGLLLNCIEASATRGKVMFNVVKKTMNETDYAGGNFVEAMNELIRRNEDKDTRSKGDLKKEH